MSNTTTNQPQPTGEMGTCWYLREPHVQNGSLSHSHCHNWHSLPPVSGDGEGQANFVSDQPANGPACAYCGAVLTCLSCGPVPSLYKAGARERAEKAAREIRSHINKNGYFQHARISIPDTWDAALADIIERAYTGEGK